MSLYRNFIVISGILMGILLYSCGGEEQKSGTNPYSGIPSSTPHDSLMQLIKMPGKDTFHVRALSSLCWILRRDNPDTGIILGKEAIALAKELNFQAGLSKSHSNVAVAYRLIGDYPAAIAHNDTALQIALQMNDSAQIAISNGALGTVYYVQGNYPRALQYYLDALKIAEALSDSNSIATQLSNIGALFIVENENDSAAKYYAKALIIDKARRDTAGISFDLSGIAGIYGRSGHPDTAIVYFMQAYALEKRSGTKYGLAKILGNIGMSWGLMGEQSHDSLRRKICFDSSIVYYNRAIVLDDEVSDRRSIAISLICIGRTYMNTGRFDEAKAIIAKGKFIADSLGILETMRDAEMNFATLYDSLHNSDSAYKHYKSYMKLRDSLQNSDKTNEMTRAQMNFEFQKERAVEQAKTAEELARQQLMLNVAIGGGILLLIVAVISIRAYRTKQRSNEIISRQKLEVENQKALVEVKQKEIIDSINYAQRIQTALLPATGEIEKQFRDAFVFFQPKDIVSGDFYWIAKTDDYTFFVTADCTGHGVPGGFMSMLGNSLLNEIVIEKKTTNTGEILDLLRLKIISALKQTGESGENKDGMDLVLCRFSNDFRNLVYSAANNPLWICRNDAMMEYKADKQPVGISVAGAMGNFTAHDIALLPGDCVYTFTDGYADQFGGPKGKKFKYKALQELLLKNQHLPMREQKELLRTAFENWKGELMQIDDVLVVGVRIL